jgi:hypothetical protein
VAAVTVRFCDEFEGGFGWIVADEPMRRCSHALVAEGRVWVIDPVDGPDVERRVTEAGQPAGVLQLLDRHNRDSRALADRLGVPYHAVPFEPIADAPFELIAIRDARRWKEAALWWADRRVLVCADAIGTAPFFVARGERLGVHPLVRIDPPRRQLAGVQPEVVLCGHGEGVLSDASPALHEALSTARRRIFSALANGVRTRRL